jgi:hypothetical protein
MTKTIFSLMLIATAFSAAALADDAPTYYSCVAGTTIVKHVMSYWGDTLPSQEQAMQSAMEECQHESEFGAYCRPLACYPTQNPSN